MKSTKMAFGCGAQPLDRRAFIKTGTGAFAIASVQTLFGTATPSKKLRLCVVGCARTKDHGNGFVVDPTGARGRGFQVMSRFAEIPNCEITVVCDVDSTAMDYAVRVLKEKTGHEPAKVRDFREAVRRNDVDAVLVATPDHSHCYIGIEAMKAGKALYLEKPIGISAGEAEVLAEAQRKTGMVFQLGTQRRSSYATKQAIEYIRSGKIGKPHWAKSWCLSDRPAIRNVKPVPVPEWLDWARGAGIRHDVLPLQLALLQRLRYRGPAEQRPPFRRYRPLGARRGVAGARLCRRRTLLLRG